jgi:hypothetical protein
MGIHPFLNSFPHPFRRQSGGLYWRLSLRYRRRRQNPM